MDEEHFNTEQCISEVIAKLKLSINLTAVNIVTTPNKLFWCLLPTIVRSDIQICAPLELTTQFLTDGY